jgi:hypothetical protein
VAEKPSRCFHALLSKRRHRVDGNASEGMSTNNPVTDTGDGDR